MTLSHGDVLPLDLKVTTSCLKLMNLLFPTALDVPRTKLLFTITARGNLSGFKQKYYLMQPKKYLFVKTILQEVASTIGKT
jgi:hypothetical protein